jgi:beta-1,4-mannosyl-glycoprotein beta-1,4-N-acetylglucosaminyltransferase
MRELQSVADVHLAIEGTHTFQGAPRTQQFAYDCQVGWSTTYACSAMADLTDFTDPWEREAAQRDYMLTAIDNVLAGLPGDTVVLLSDADEIPRRDSVPQSLGPGETWRVCSRHSMYFVNLICITWGGDWHGTRVIRLDDLRKTTPQELRGFGLGHLHRPEDRPGGWHFSFLGGEQAIRQKLASWAHSEALPLATPENIARALGRLEDWDPARSAQLVPVPIDETFPQCIRDHPERYSTLTQTVPVGTGGVPRWVPYGQYGAVRV